MEATDPAAGDLGAVSVRRVPATGISAGDAGPLLLLVLASLVVMLARRDARHDIRQPEIYAAAAALVLLSRGLRLRRPVTARNARWAAIGLAVAVAADVDHVDVVGVIATVLIGIALVLPAASQPDPDLLPVLVPLVDRTPEDPLAPFVLHSSKSYFVNGGGTAAIGYRTKFGMAVVGGDPVGHPSDFPVLIAQFQSFCRSKGWRVAVLGAGEGCRELWARRRPGQPRLRSVAFGRDVVLDVQNFSMVGRQFRNLRQAVNRARNAGVSTEVVAESGIPDLLRGELLRVAEAADRGNDRRGFSMILDRLLTGEIPGLWLIVARDRGSRVVGFQRYATADGGREVSLDIPCRRPDAPNGTDELMTLAMLDWARERGGRHLSLSFAAFPELFENRSRGCLGRAMYRLVHLGDGLLEIESLYVFLRKFHGLGQSRFAMFPLSAFLPALAAMLTLEFAPHHHRRWARRGPESVAP